MSADAVTAYHREFVSRLRALLGEDLVGLYAGGSFALGGYTPGRSDLDVAAVCSHRLAHEVKEKIAAALRHEVLPCPARGLELVLYSDEVVRRGAAEAGFEVDLNSGASMSFRVSFDPSDVPRHWYVIDRAILREHGKALLGPPAGRLFARIRRETLLAILAESVRWHEHRGLSRDDDAVLNACRALRYAVQGVWSSKPDAGRWAVAHVADPGLVTAGLAAHTADGRLPRPRVEAFLRETAERLDTGRRPV